MSKCCDLWPPILDQVNIWAILYKKYKIYNVVMYNKNLVSYKIIKNKWNQNFQVVIQS